MPVTSASTERVQKQENLEQCMAIQGTQANSITSVNEQLDSISAGVGQLQGQILQNRMTADQIAHINKKLSLLVEKADLDSDGIGGSTAACADFSPQPDKLVVGQLESVWLQALQLALPARIDTGAETASIDARNIELFERDGETWVRFSILHPETAEPLQLERLLKRRVSIIQSNSIEAERRPVIELGIAIGAIKQTAEFTLSDRSHLNHQMLIGRNILQDVMIVDVSQTNIAPHVPDELSGITVNVEASQ